MEISVKNISKIFPYTRFSLIGRPKAFFWQKKKNTAR